MVALARMDRLKKLADNYEYETLESFRTCGEGIKITPEDAAILAYLRGAEYYIPFGGWGVFAKGGDKASEVYSARHDSDGYTAPDFVELLPLQGDEGDGYRSNYSFSEGNSNWTVLNIRWVMLYGEESDNEDDGGRLSDICDLTLGGMYYDKDYHSGKFLTYGFILGGAI